jgi:hypothetical protein
VNDKIFGLRLDSVSDVMDIPLEQVQPTPPIASEATQRFLSGVVQVGERVVILLNLREIFDIDALSPPCCVRPQPSGYLISAYAVDFRHAQHCAQGGATTEGCPYKTASL